MRKITLMLCLLSFSLLFSQKEISGKISDNTGAALPGVNILEKGTSNGTSTDLDGNYKIKVKENATLEYSYLGFATVTKSASEGSTLNVALTAGDQQLQ